LKKRSKKLLRLRIWGFGAIWSNPRRQLIKVLWFFLSRKNAFLALPYPPGESGDVKPAGTTSLWEATAGMAPTWPRLTGTLHAQVAVIGAGYTGLSAALHLGEAGIDTAVLDAHSPGWGASGRNGGQVIAGLKPDPDALEEMFGLRLVATCGGAPDLVFDLIRRHGIACDPVRTGWLQLAVSEATLTTIRTRAGQWRRRGAAVSILDREQAAHLTGSALYVGATLDRRGGTVQPLAYARGLAAAAHARGCRIFAESPATRLARSGDGWLVETPHGAVAARTVILATNAYTDTLCDELRRSVVPVPSFQIATDPLPEELRRTILPHGQSGSDTRRLLRYFRLDAAGRLVMGARGAFGTVSAAKALRLHLRGVREIFPQAAGLAFPYQWGGLVAVTTDHLPHLHQLAPGLLAGLGYNGRGVAMATAMGRELAAWACGAEPEALGFPVTGVSPMRLHRFSRLGARAAVQYLGLRDALDRRA
jgi:glycine/D-amino acid oxidase-like deaminating enzyme